MKTPNELLRAIVDLKHGTRGLDVTPAPAGAGGCTGYHKGKAVFLAVPPGRNAYERTVRIHEAIHAQRQKAPKRGTSADPSVQAIQDVLVHTRDWPRGLPRAAMKDALCAAYQDLRKCAANALAAAADPTLYNSGLVCVIRALAIAATCGYASRHSTSKTRDTILKLANRFCGEDVTDELVRIIGATSRKGRRRSKHCPGGMPDGVPEARERFRRLLRQEEGKRKKGNLPGSEPNCGSIPRILELPHTEDCDPAGLTCQSARSGAHLRPGRIPACLANGTAAGLFRRPRREQGGAVVIDASGSMEPTAELLAAVCRAAPGATVAYYSGGDHESAFVVYARDGRRFAGEALPEVLGGNTCDLWALQWLLEQDGPRVFVTDRGFCGGSPGDDHRALLLLADQERKGEVTVIPSLPEALAHFTARKESVP